jgi:hypothetical protein
MLNVILMSTMGHPALSTRRHDTQLTTLRKISLKAINVVNFEFVVPNWRSVSVNFTVFLQKKTLKRIRAQCYKTFFVRNILVFVISISRHLMRTIGHRALSTRHHDTQLTTLRKISLKAITVVNFEFVVPNWRSVSVNFTVFLQKKL